MSVHTRGPWKLAKRTGPTVHVTGPRAAPGMPGGIYKHAPGNIVAFVHDDADAALIAVSPDLLRLLERALYLTDNCDSAEEWEDFENEAVEAIAKARGRR